MIVLRVLRTRSANIAPMAQPTSAIVLSNRWPATPRLLKALVRPHNRAAVMDRAPLIALLAPQRPIVSFALAQLLVFALAMPSHSARQ